MLPISKHGLDSVRYAAAKTMMGIVQPVAMAMAVVVAVVMQVGLGRTYHAAVMPLCFSCVVGVVWLGVVVGKRITIMQVKVNEK